MQILRGRRRNDESGTGVEYAGIQKYSGARSEAAVDAAVGGRSVILPAKGRP